MTATADAPLTMIAGVSGEELALMREAAVRVCALAAGAGRAASAPDVFDVLAEPFFPLPPGGPGRWHRADGRHWCVDQ